MNKLYASFGITEKALRYAEEAEREIRPLFSVVEKTEAENTAKVLEAFRKEKISAAHFAESSGYGYDDIGRDALDRVYAHAFGTEAAIVRAQFVSGTHALTVMLFSVLRPGDILLSVTGNPYDTLTDVICGKGGGSLCDFGIGYDMVELKNGRPDKEAILKKLDNDKIRAVYMTRSKGYAWRESLSVDEMEEIAAMIRKKKPGTLILTDNCYGEFVGTREPDFADLFAGSLIKNPGGGLAPCGGYIAGKAEYVRLAADRLTAPGIGLECGINFGLIKSLYLGFFMAPHTVANAVKSAIFTGALMEKYGFSVCPRPTEKREDIIEAVQLGSREKMIAFCKGLQAASPVDSFVSPVPSAMPGYQDEIIMAAGAFTQGSSIEISADGPVKPPYITYTQGGLTYESAKFAVLCAASFAEKATDH